MCYVPVTSSSNPKQRANLIGDLILFCHSPPNFIDFYLLAIYILFTVLFLDKLVCCFVCLAFVTPGGTQGLLLVPHLEITPVMLWSSSGLPGIKPGMIVLQAAALSACTDSPVPQIKMCFKTKSDRASSDNCNIFVWNKVDLFFSP